MTAVIDSKQQPKRSYKVLIIGAGISGIVAGAQLQRHFPHVFRRGAADSFVIVERGPQGSFGGTWHWNQYPGAACDVPSHLYSISFFPKADWSEKWSPQSEILAYLRACAAHFHLGEFTRFTTEVVGAHWDAVHNGYLVTLRAVDAATGVAVAGSEELVFANVVISGVGMLNTPSLPDIDGLDSFKGPVVHSARWDKDLDVKGKKVAVIGTGASAIQFVPEIAKAASHVTVFQRTRPYVIARGNYKYSAIAKFIFRFVPFARQLYRLGMLISYDMGFVYFLRSKLNPLPMVVYLMVWLHRRGQVHNAELWRRLTPNYPFGCKRMLITDDWYPTLARPNVTLVDAQLDSGIARVEPRGVVTRDGRLHEADVLALGTGFKTTAMLWPLEFVGEGGRSLRKEWATGNGTRAYKGVFVEGFPNLFVLYGPNTNLGHSSIIFM
ncbi:hypothetical protein HK405_014144, partial [Cladochytrium tenue]